MTIQMNVAEAKAKLSELISRAEAGEEVVIARGAEPIARLTRIAKERDVAAAIAEIKAARQARAPTTTAEILAWRDEGRRF